MLRNVEKEEFGHGQPIFQSVLAATGRAARHDRAAPRATGRAFIYHLAEGVDPVLRDEFALLDDARLRARRLDRDPLDRARRDADYARWAAARAAAAIVWSPFSNLWLYGGTTDVLSARASTACACASARTGRRRARATCSAS